MMFSLRIKELRRQADLNQQELADKLGISVHTVSSYERGVSIPEDETKLKIAKLFNVSLDYLFGLIKMPYSYKRENTICIPIKIPDDDLRKIQEYADVIIQLSAKSRIK